MELQLTTSNWTLSTSLNACGLYSVPLISWSKYLNDDVLYSKNMYTDSADYSQSVILLTQQIHLEHKT